jgi:hypothetical protein
MTAAKCVPASFVCNVIGKILVNAVRRFSLGTKILEGEGKARISVRDVTA